MVAYSEIRDPTQGEGEWEVLGGVKTRTSKKNGNLNVYLEQSGVGTAKIP
jgi:hypothetical protein